MVLIAASIVVKEVTGSSLSVVVVFPSVCSSGLVTELAIGLALLAQLAPALASMASWLAVVLALAVGVAKLVTLVCFVLIRFDFLCVIGIFLNPGSVIGLTWSILARI